MLLFQIYLHIYFTLLIKYSWKITLVSCLYSFSAIQPHFDINFPWSLGYIGKLVFWCPWGNYFTPGFVCIQLTVPRNIKLALTLPCQASPGSSRALKIHFLCPEKFTLGQCRVRTRDLSICSRTHNHWTNAALLSVAF